MNKDQQRGTFDGARASCLNEKVYRNIKQIQCHDNEYDFSDDGLTYSCLSLSFVATALCERETEPTWSMMHRKALMNMRRLHCCRISNNLHCGQRPCKKTPWWVKRSVKNNLLKVVQRDDMTPTSINRHKSTRILSQTRTLLYHGVGSKQESSSRRQRHRRQMILARALRSQSLQLAVDLPYHPKPDPIRRLNLSNRP